MERKLVQIKRNEADGNVTWIFPRTTSTGVAIGKNYQDKWGRLSDILLPKNDAYENYGLRLGKELMFATKSNALVPLAFDFASNEADPDVYQFSLDKLSKFSLGGEDAYWKDLFVHDKIWLNALNWINKFGKSYSSQGVMYQLNGLHRKQDFMIKIQQNWSTLETYNIGVDDLSLLDPSEDIPETQLCIDRLHSDAINVFAGLLNEHIDNIVHLIASNETEETVRTAIAQFRADIKQRVLTLFAENQAKDAINLHTPEGLFVNEKEWFSGFSEAEFTSEADSATSALGFVTDIAFDPLRYEEDSNGLDNKQILPVKLKKSKFELAYQNEGDGWDSEHNMPKPGGFIKNVIHALDANNPLKIILTLVWGLVEPNVDIVGEGEACFISNITLAWDQANPWKLNLVATKTEAAVFKHLKVVKVGASGENGEAEFTASQANYATTVIINNKQTGKLSFELQNLTASQNTFTFKVLGNNGSWNDLTNEQVTVGIKSDTTLPFALNLDKFTGTLALQNNSQLAIKVANTETGEDGDIFIIIRETLQVDSTTGNASADNTNNYVIIHNGDSAQFNAPITTGG